MKVELSKISEETQEKSKLIEYVGNMKLEEEFEQKIAALGREILKIKKQLEEEQDIVKYKELETKLQQLKDEYYGVDLKWQIAENLIIKAQNIIRSLEEHIYNLNEDKYKIEEIIQGENIDCMNYVPLHKFVAESDIDIIKHRLYNQSYYQTDELIDIDDFDYYSKDVDLCYYVEPVIDYRIYDRIYITDFKVYPLFLAKDLWKVSKIKNNELI